MTLGLAGKRSRRMRLRPSDLAHILTGGGHIWLQLRKFTDRLRRGQGTRERSITLVCVPVLYVGIRTDCLRS
jgi:hypothetical protein